MSLVLVQSLHSPTPIVGTPFDVKANYEYPFPANHDHHPSSSVPTIPSPILTSRPPSAGSLLSGSPPPHILKSTSPPPVSASYTYSHTHPKMRSREPPVPPGLITKRRIEVCRQFTRTGYAKLNVMVEGEEEGARGDWGWLGGFKPERED